MRSFLIPLALSALAVANPAPQEIDLDMVAAAPNPTYTIAVGVANQTVTYDTSLILAAATQVSSVTVAVTNAATDAPTDEPTDVPSERLVRRGNCAAQPSGASGAPSYSPDNAAAFASKTAFGDVASAAPTPTGYDQTFSNLAASNNAYGYLGFTTLQTYDTQACASKCDKISGCMAVNIYFERDPSLDPGTGCPDPPSVTMIKCVFWGGPVDSTNAVNKGQWRQNFQVLIAGSNGYVNKTLATPAGYKPATYIGSAAINAPYDSQGFNSYMGSTVFTAGPFNASLCADYCNAQNKYNLAHPPTDGTPVQTCQFFNTYILYVNKTSNIQGQYCAIYSEAWPSSYATNVGQYRGSDHYMIMYSYTYTNSTSPGAPNKQGAIYQARADLKWHSLQPYCSTLLGYSAPLATTTTTTTISPVVTVTSIQTVTTTTGNVYPVANKRRADSADYVTISAASAYPDRLLANRAVSTPDVLTKYPATVVSSACSLVATPVTSTSTITSTSTVSLAASTTTTSTTTTVNIAAPSVCATNPLTVDFDINNGCGCSYTESCGELDSQQCYFSAALGDYTSFSQCASYCDEWEDCKGFNFYGGDDTACVLCRTDGDLGDADGAAGAISGKRGSCGDPQCHTN